MREALRESDPSSARLIVGIANDAALEPPEGQRVMFDQARWRAMEHRRAVVRCASSGISAFILPDGTVALALDRTRGQSAETLLVDSISTDCRFSPYTQCGPWIVYACVLFGVGAWVRWIAGKTFWGKRDVPSRSSDCTPASK